MEDIRRISELAALCEALGNPVRLRILKKLCEREWYIYELAKELGISRQLIYLHIRKLENAGLVEGEIRFDPDDPRAKKFYRARLFRLVVDNEVMKRLEEE
ncbi:ArsR/SmtB family transcription factor [Geoglobus sp.]